jgi:hypothetical protein
MPRSDEVLIEIFFYLFTLSPLFLMTDLMEPKSHLAPTAVALLALGAK